MSEHLKCRGNCETTWNDGLFGNNDVKNYLFLSKCSFNPLVGTSLCCVNIPDFILPC